MYGHMMMMRKKMGKMKAYMMDLQEEADYAISEGANSAGEVIMHLRNSGIITGVNNEKDKK